MCANSRNPCNTLGFAAISGACSIDYQHGIAYKVGYVLDRGGYDGIQTAAHELGHLYVKIINNSPIIRLCA